MIEVRQRHQSHRNVFDEISVEATRLISVCSEQLSIVYKGMVYLFMSSMQELLEDASFEESTLRFFASVDDEDDADAVDGPAVVPPRTFASLL